jgi:hypothetical protein
MKEECCSLGHAVQYLLYNHNIPAYSNQTARELIRVLQKSVRIAKARKSSAWQYAADYIITGTSKKLVLKDASLRSFIQKGKYSYLMPLLFPAF